MSDTTTPLRTYQSYGADWIARELQNHKAVLLADPAGLGKTLQALSAADKLQAKSILVICPAGARRVWAQEIQRWFPSWSPRVVLVEPGASRLHSSRLVGSPALILVLSYDEMSASRSDLAFQLTLRHWDLLILDEAHYLKNPSNRTRAVYGLRGSDAGLQKHVGKVLLLTGTPTPNHAGELWQHYRTFWPDALGAPLSQAQFEDRFTRYKDTKFGRHVVGSKNQAVLRTALGPMVLRRRKDDVLPELPPLVLQDVSLAAAAWVRPDVGALSALSDDALLARLRQPDAQLSSLRRGLGEHKVAPAILWVQERMESTEKLLIFAWHHTVIEGLSKGLLEFSPVVVTGETSSKARADGIDAFQTDPRRRIFIGQILAAGTAITLTAANEVAIVEPSWVPGENVQAICRAHRLGQRDSVLASFLYIPGTLDERIMQVFRRKAGEIAELQGEAAA